MATAKIKSMVPLNVLKHPLTRRLLLARLALRGERLRAVQRYYDDDLFLVSYPKSGNTWATFLVGNLLHPDTPPDLESIEYMVPESYLNTNRALERAPRPRVIKSHDAFRPEFRRVVYIVRDPRDVAVSYYNYAKKMRWVNDSATYDDVMPRYLDGKMDAFGSWGENIGSWLGAREGTRDFRLIRYEDMLENTQEALDRISRFMRFDASEEDVRMAVERSSVERLRAMEKEQGARWKMTRYGDHNRSFFRRATAGAWREELPERWAEQIVSRWGGLMERLGYTESQPAKTVLS